MAGTPIQGTGVSMNVAGKANTISGSHSRTDNSTLITVNGQRKVNPNSAPNGLTSDYLSMVSAKYGAGVLSLLPKNLQGGQAQIPATAANTPAAKLNNVGNATAATTAAPQNPTVPNNGMDSSTVDYASAQKNLLAGGLQGDALAGAQQSLASKYHQGLMAVQQSGGAAPDTQGDAMGKVAQSLPQTQDTTNVDQLFSEDPTVNGLMTNIAQLLSPQQQTSSLMDDYQKLYKQSGLGDINKELIDADTIINGTEGDIRNEVQAAGGFGTDSQIQAMSLARNKSLIARYNQLTQQKTDATNQLNSMMQLDSQDKQMAQTRVNNQINTMFQLANFKQQATNNIKEGFNSLVSKVGYAGALKAYGTDPGRLSQIEQIMGLPEGGLSKLASIPDIDMELKQAQLAASQASTANSYSEINARNNPAPKSQTQAQTVAQGYADRAQTADKVISQLGGKFSSPSALGGTTLFGLGVPNFLKSADRQQYEQAQRDFVNAVLRPESGAAISESEFSSAQKQYFPQAGDSNSVVAQKAYDRQLKIQNLYQQANASPIVNSGDVINYGGQRYTVDENGNMTPL